MSNKHKKKKNTEPQIIDTIIDTVLDNKQIAMVALIILVAVIVIIVAVSKHNKPGAKEIIDLDISGNAVPVAGGVTVIQDSEASYIDYSTGSDNADYSAGNYSDSNSYTPSQDGSQTTTTSSVVVNGQEVTIPLEESETAIIVDSPAGSTTTTDNSSDNSSTNTSGNTSNTTSDSNTNDNSGDDDSFTFELPFVPVEELN